MLMPEKILMLIYFPMMQNAFHNEGQQAPWTTVAQQIKAGVVLKGRQRIAT
jgi:hypothetical protein